jgi:hypothetical protein
MTTLRRVVVAAASVVALVLVIAGGGACSSADHPELCYPGDLIACSCSAGAQGVARCDTVAGSGYGACDCTADAGADAPDEASNDAAASDAAGDVDEGLLPFLAPCETNAQCETGLCFPFNAKGPQCTEPCSVDSDCPPPSPGCSNMKVCKSP